MVTLSQLHLRKLAINQYSTVRLSLTAVTAHLKINKLLLFAFAEQYNYVSQKVLVFKLALFFAMKGIFIQNLTITKNILAYSC